MTRTHTVERTYTARDGLTRVYVSGWPRPLLCDEPLSEGAAVRIVGEKAVPVR